MLATPSMTPAGKPPDLTVDDKAKAGFAKWFRTLEAQTAVRVACCHDASCATCFKFKITRCQCYLLRTGREGATYPLLRPQIVSDSARRLGALHRSAVLQNLGCGQALRLVSGDWSARCDCTCRRLITLELLVKTRSRPSLQMMLHECSQVLHVTHSSHGTQL